MFGRSLRISRLKGRDIPMKEGLVERVIRAFFLVFSLLLFVPGCVTMQEKRPVIIPVDQFPAFIVPQGQDSEPASDVDAVPDIDILALSEEIKTMLDESIVGTGNPKQRLQALMDLINENVKLDAAEDKYGTKTATETFEEGSGNCLSFSNMFVAMARYCGLDSGFQEIPTPPNWVKDGEVLLFTRHIGAMVDVYEPGQLFINIEGSFTGEKMVVETRDQTQYLFAPLLPLSARYSRVPSSRSITDKRAFALFYNNIGSQYLTEGNTLDAFRYFVKALKLDPEVSFIWSNLAVAYGRNNQEEAAEKAFLQSLSINQGKDELTGMSIMSNLARHYTRQGNIEEAAVYEEKVRSYRDMNPYYHYSMGEIDFYEESYEHSIGHYNEAIKRKSDEPQFHYALALAYLKLGKIERAEKSMEKAISYSKDRRIEEYYSKVWEQLSENNPMETESL
jgi:tetratricopeptide (TPR) repeat protein